jgi:hypothetical protein
MLRRDLTLTEEATALELCHPEILHL